MIKERKFKKRIVCKDTKEVVKNYNDYLRTRHWRKIRIKTAEKNNYHCELCEKEVKVGFHIHHKTYRNLGNENLEDLMFLCENCHQNLHSILRSHRNIDKPKKKRKLLSWRNIVLVVFGFLLAIFLFRSDLIKIFLDFLENCLTK